MNLVYTRKYKEKKTQFLKNTLLTHEVVFFESGKSLWNSQCKAIKKNFNPSEKKSS